MSTPVARSVVVGALAAGLVLSMPAAPATDVSRDRLALLAERAPRDPAALDELRRVDHVDGQRVDLATALRDADGDEARARVETLLRGLREGDATAGRELADPRGTARHILAGRRFHPRRTPRPLRGVFRWLGARLRPIGEPIGRAFDRLARHVPGGVRTLWVTVASLVLAVALLTSIRIVRRRSRGATTAAHAARRRRQGETPDELERAAARAEDQGDYDRAIRLRFRAGLLRLDALGAIEWRPSLTSGQARRRLRLAEFDTLARSFDAVAYGGRAAAASDAAAARAGWARVLEHGATR